jgi:ABC-type antimicrobial peptide transport system permease subunit
MNGKITDINGSSWGHTWEGQLPGTSEIEFSGVTVNYNFLETIGIPLKEGRSYSKDFGDEAETVILNESAIKAMGMTNPIDKWIDLFGMKRKIIGVAKDFHLQSMYHAIKPLFIICNPNYTNSILVRLESGNESNTIERIDKLFHQYNPGLPFEVRFVNDDYNALYASEQRVASLSKYFAVIAIIISCLGLFGMATFNVERRTKEIGIRKVLGASGLRIVQLLSVDFTLIVLVSIVISLPIAATAADYWLDKFAYRIELDWWFFAGAALLVLAVSWITIGAQTIKASTANPVKSLRSE